MSNETKQTAVEWLIKELQKRDMDVLIRDLYKQAKLIERKQIEKAFNKGNKMGNSPFADSEWYYIATYGGNK
jgi:hypothetical protein